jgi:two-component system NtrC family response regulator
MTTNLARSTTVLFAAGRVHAAMHDLRRRVAALPGVVVLDAATPAELEARVGLSDVTVALRDLDAAWDPVEALREHVAGTRVMVLTASPEIDEAVRLLTAGFAHYACERTPVETLLGDATRLVEAGRARAAASVTIGAIEPPALIGASPALLTARTLIERIARSRATTVLITGESGTGKDVFARTLHALSARGGGPFLNITCSAIPDNLLESELFGHERGSFTDARERKLGLIEQAHGGTVFLDEIGEMSPGLQSKLLRLLEERKFRRVGGSADLSPDIRVVAATNRDLRALVREGRFREDLYYRLAVLEVELPPLRARPADIAPLAAFFLAQFSLRFGRDVRGVSPAALALLQGHPWPGNVRELRNTLERAVLLCEGPNLAPDDIQLMASAPTALGSSDTAFRLPEGGVVLSDLERDLVRQALERSGGNQTRAAQLLGMTRDQLRYRADKGAQVFAE